MLLPTRNSVRPLSPSLLVLLGGAASKQAEINLNNLSLFTLKRKKSVIHASKASTRSARECTTKVERTRAMRV